MLTAKNLNDAIDYLTTQDLDTRRKLIGIGIVCGLEVSSDAGTFVDISKGVGVTSRGYLISQEDVHLTYYRPFADKAVPPYEYFAPGGSGPLLWEMHTAQEYLDSEDEEMVKIGGNSDFDLSEMAVLLYLEIENKDLQKCIGEDCLEKGINRIHRIKRLLVNQDDLLNLITAGKEEVTEGSLRESLNKHCQLPAISLERLNYNLSDITSLNLGSIHSWERLKDAYGEAARPAVIRIGKALHQCYQVHTTELDELFETNPFEGFHLTDPDSNKLMALLSDKVDANDLSVQYCYDLLRDLVLAYNEFVDASVEYNSICCPDADLFPLHLMLDKVIPDEGVKSVFRHYFMPSPALDGLHGKREKLVMLFQRMVRMTEVFDVPFYNSLKQIKITPGKWTCNPLSRRSMGFYFPTTEESPLYKLWSYELKQKCQPTSLLSYQAPTYSKLQHVLQPLLFDITNYNHFRVEGHIGQEYRFVKRHLEEQISSFNLPFDVLGIKLSRDHLDVEIEDSCFNDLQTTYRCNRDEYLSCVRSITTFIGGIVEPLEEIFTKYPKLRDMEVGGEGSALPFIRTLGDMYLILQLYHYQLQQVEVRMPEHIKNFDYQLFRVPHFIVFAFTLIIQIILEMLSNNIREVQLSFLQFMAVKALFERVIDDCMDSKFKALYDMFQERKLQLQFGRLFPGYANGRGGMEHIAGVEKGGTFILVYDEIPEDPDRPQDEPQDDPREPDDPCFGYSKAKTLKAGVMEFAYTIYSQSYLVDDLNFFAGRDEGSEAKPEEKDNTYYEEVGSAKTKRGFNENQSRYSKQDSRQSFEPRYDDPDVFVRDKFGEYQREQVPRKDYRVVADFAVPYRCCSSCLAVEQLPEEEVSLHLPKDEFCHRDTKRYPFELSPEGGEVEGEGVVTDENGNYYFQPSEVKDGLEDVELQYNATDHTQAIISVKVYNPQASFVENRKTPGRVGLENTSTGADTYEWKIVETGETFSTTNLTLVADNYDQNDLTVTLTARRGPCSSTTEETTVRLRDPQVEVSISLPADNFCKDDGPVPFTVSPAGGSITPLNGVTQSDPSAPFFFNPKTATGKQITFTYSADGNSDSTTIQVHNPIAGFEVVSNDSDKIVLADKSENAEKVEWYVNEMPVTASGGSVSIPISNYEGSSVNVRVVAHSWECSDEFKMDIPVQQQVSFDLQQPKGSTNYQYCNNDRSAYPFYLDPTGGNVTGDSEGISQNASGNWVFSPLNVAAGTYTFNYMGESITVTVQDVPDLSLSFQIVEQWESGAQINFTLNTAMTGQFAWSFPGTLTSGFDRDYKGPFMQTINFNRGTSSITVRVTKAVGNGCIAQDTQVINLQSNQPGTGGGRVIDTGVLLNQPGATGLVSSGFTAHNTFLTNSNNLTNSFRTTTSRTKIEDGSATTAIANNYSATMKDTSSAMKKLKRGDTQSRDYLAQVYLAQVEDMMQVIAAQRTDLSKNSNLYKLGTQMVSELQEMKKQGANINPGGALKRIIEQNRQAVKGKPNSEEILQGLEKLL